MWKRCNESSKKQSSPSRSVDAEREKKEDKTATHLLKKINRIKDLLKNNNMNKLRRILHIRKEEDVRIVCEEKIKHLMFLLESNREMKALMLKERKRIIQNCVMRRWKKSKKAL